MIFESCVALLLFAHIKGLCWSSWKAAMLKADGLKLKLHYLCESQRKLLSKDGCICHETADVTTWHRYGAII